MAGELEHVRKAMRELRKTIASLPADPSPRSVHRLRTALRRVEAIAAMLEDAHHKRARRLVHSVEPVRKAAGLVRDLDVLTGNAKKLAKDAPGETLDRLLAHFSGARQKHAEELHRRLHEKHKAIFRELKEYTQLASVEWKDADAEAVADRNRESIHTAAMNLVRELAAWPVLDADNLHAFRLKARTLRYTLRLDNETFPDLVEALGQVQRLIGDWHDWEQLQTAAHEVLTEEEDRATLERIALTVQRRLSRALGNANRFRAKYLAAPLAMGA